MATKPSPEKLTVLVTGASSGIGEVLARCFAASGRRLVLVARSADKLKALAHALHAQHGVAVDVLPADLAQAGAAAALAATLKRKRRPVDVLVNNTGPSSFCVEVDFSSGEAYRPWCAAGSSGQCWPKATRRAWP